MLAMDDTEHPIRRIRRSLGLTAEQLAAKAELASATVYRAERGISEPSRSTRQALAAVLGVRPDELITHAPEPGNGSTGNGTKPPHTDHSPVTAGVGPHEGA